MQPSRDTDPEEDEDYENDLEVDEDDESWVNFNQKNSIFNFTMEPKSLCEFGYSDQLIR